MHTAGRVELNFFDILITFHYQYNLCIKIEREIFFLFAISFLFSRLIRKFFFIFDTESLTYNTEINNDDGVHDEPHITSSFFISYLWLHY